MLLFSGLVASRQLRLRDLIPRLKLNATGCYLVFPGFVCVCGDSSLERFVCSWLFCQTVATKFNWLESLSVAESGFKTPPLETLALQ